MRNQFTGKAVTKASASQVIAEHTSNTEKLLIGRSEWCQLPKLNLPAIKAKIDTGAKTSAIHAINIEPFTHNGHRYVRFDVYPLQGNTDVLVRCQARMLGRRLVMSSNGQKENRYVISTPLKMGKQTWRIELTLANRDPLRFRLLLGREALGNRFLIDPHVTCRQRNLRHNTVLSYYS